MQSGSRNKSQQSLYDTAMFCLSGRNLLDGLRVHGFFALVDLDGSPKTNKP